MDITMLGGLIGQYGGVMGATKIIVDFVKKMIPIPDEHKSWVLPLLAIIVAGTLNYFMKGGVGGINDFIEGIVLGLSTSKTHDILKTDKAPVVQEQLSEEDALLLSKYEAHDTESQ